MQDIAKTFEIHSNLTPHTCPECGQDIRDFAGHRLDGAINHVLGHGWKLLHVGAEAGLDNDGKTLHHTVAFLGKPR